jgi:hypothetical protein
MINRYPFPVPEWARVIWASPEAKALWAPRVSQIIQTYGAAERASVGRFRRCARQTILHSEYTALNRKALDAGLVAVALEETHLGGIYSSRPGSGSKNAYQTVLADSAQTARMFARALEAKDDMTIGDLLGYPECCSKFFIRTWNELGRTDPTWDMTGLDSPEVYQADGPLESNSLLRWLGVRWTPHLPCSFNCAKSHALGLHFRSVVGPMEAAWMDELLGSPMEWSAFHGIGELKHPLFKISFKTDATAEKLVIQRKGLKYPEAGARGNVFPYRRHAEPKPLPVTLVENPRKWTDNGFSSKEAMEKAHAVFSEYFWRHFDRKREVLDLGCGNGELVRKLTDRPTGLEVEVSRAKAARQTGMRCLTGNISDVSAWKDEARDIVLLMLGRLTEIPNPEEVIEALKGRTVIVYTYGNWNLHETAVKLGLKLDFQQGGPNDPVQLAVLA